MKMLNKKREKKAEELLETFDPTSRFRKFKGRMAIVITIIAAAMSLFHLYTAGFGVLLDLKQKAVHLAFVLVLIFLLYPTSEKHKDSKKLFYLDVLLAFLGLVVTMYLVVNYESFGWKSRCFITV